MEEPDVLSGSLCYSGAIKVLSAALTLLVLHG